MEEGGEDKELKLKEASDAIARLVPDGDQPAGGTALTNPYMGWWHGGRFGDEREATATSRWPASVALQSARPWCPLRLIRAVVVQEHVNTAGDEAVAGGGWLSGGGVVWCGAVDGVDAADKFPADSPMTVRTAWAAVPRGTPVMLMRDRLDVVFADQDFTVLYPADGRPGLSPGQLALVSVLQFAENLSDRAAADAVRTRIDWKYGLGLELDDPGFDHSVLSEFRARLAEGDRADQLLQLMLEHLVAELPRATPRNHRTTSMRPRPTRPSSRTYPRASRLAGSAGRLPGHRGGRRDEEVRRRGGAQAGGQGCGGQEGRCGEARQGAGGGRPAGGRQPVGP